MDNLKTALNQNERLWNSDCRTTWENFWSLNWGTFRWVSTRGLATRWILSWGLSIQCFYCDRTVCFLLSFCHPGSKWFCWKPVSRKLVLGCQYLDAIEAYWSRLLGLLERVGKHCQPENFMNISSSRIKKLQVCSDTSCCWLTPNPFIGSKDVAIKRPENSSSTNAVPSTPPPFLMF